MGALLRSLDGAGAYIAVFLLGAAVVAWLLKEVKQVRVALDKSNERLLSERDLRAKEGIETAKLIMESSQILSYHTKTIDRMLDRWTSSPA